MTVRRRLPFAGVATLTPVLVVSLGLGYVVYVAVGRLLSPADFAVFAAFWGLLFGIGGTLAPLEQESARLVVVHGQSAALRRVLLRAALVVATALVVLGAAVGRVVADGVLHGSLVLLTLAVVAGCGFAVQYVVRGGWLGEGHVRRYAFLVLCEALLRAVLLGLLVVTTSPGLVACGAAIGAGSFAWLLVVGRPHSDAEQAEGVPTLRQALPNMLGLMLAAVFTAASITGFPALAAAVADPEDRARLGVLLAALTVTRLPLLLLSPVQALLVPGLTRRLLDQGWGRTWPLVAGLVGAVIAAGGVVCALAWGWGSEVVSLLYGDSYRIADRTVAAMTAGATLTAVLLVLAAFLVALDGHAWVVAAWAACFGGIVAGLLLPGPALVTRIVTALLVGPAVGNAVAALGLGMRGAATQRHDASRPAGD